MNCLPRGENLLADHDRGFAGRSGFLLVLDLVLVLDLDFEMGISYSFRFSLFRISDFEFPVLVVAVNSEEHENSSWMTIVTKECLAVSCVWIVLARSFESLSDEEGADARKLGMQLRETQWASLLGAAALLGSLLWAPLEIWVARLLAGWITAICAEQLIRAVLAWRQPPGLDDDPVPPYRLAIRQSLLVHGNPLTSLFESFERRFGVSFRSSWTIRFVRRAFWPILFVSGACYWGLTSLTLIGPSEVGLRESFGVVDGQLASGLHWKLPWPFGQVRRFEVKRIESARVGGHAGEHAHRPRAILWSKAHAHEEFPLVLGTGTDAVSVDALIYYKIREDTAGLLDYAYHTQNPVTALHGRTHRRHDESGPVPGRAEHSRRRRRSRVSSDCTPLARRCWWRGASARWMRVPCDRATPSSCDLET